MLQFVLARGIGDVAVRRALTYIGRNGMAWRDLVGDASSMHDMGLSPVQIDNILSARPQALALSETLEKHDIVVMPKDQYPESLRLQLGAKCPPLLFAMGNTSLLHAPTAGFTGSRKTSSKGLRIAASCAEQLVDSGITVVAGYAAGTDLAAHVAALERGGHTVFVLAEGILRMLKKDAVRDLLTDENHIFVSQFLPEVPWTGAQAMQRSSVIVGLSRAMILVESDLRGGAYAAGQEALRIGCPLFVVDYAEPAASAEGNAYFLRQGGERLRGVRGVPNVARVKEIALGRASTAEDRVAPAPRQLTFA